MATPRLQNLILVMATPLGALDSARRNWISRGDLHHRSEAAEPLVRVLDILGAPPPAALAACRFAGQTGSCPEGWVAAADPVFFEPMLDHLRLRIPARPLAEDAGQRLFTELNRRLGDDRLEFRFAGGNGYLMGGELGPTPSLSAATVAGAEPSRYWPEGSAAPRLHRLLSEVQMVLHDAAGAADVNALWIWGGGAACPAPGEALPPLYSDDPLFRGYWQLAGHRASPAPRALAECIDSGHPKAVATVRDDPENLLRDAERRLRTGALSELRCLFADGADVTLRRRHRWRVWRRAAAGGVT